MPFRTKFARRSRATTATTASRRCALRDWLESVAQRERSPAARRSRARPSTPAEAPAEVDERAQRVEALRARLLAGVPELRGDRDDEQQARWLLAYLLDYHRREDNVALVGVLSAASSCPRKTCSTSAQRSPDSSSSSELDDIMHKKSGKPTGSVVDRYRYPPQEMEIDAGDELSPAGQEAFGEVVAVDRMARTIDVRKGPSRADDASDGDVRFT